MRRISVLMVFAVMGVVHGAPLSAQLGFWEVGRPGDDIGSVAFSAGSLRPQSELPDGASFGSGVTLGVSATVWPFRFVGFRANAARARTPGQEGQTFSSVAFEDPVVWLYSMDLALRYPFGERIVLAPYVAGGYGGKTYLWSTNRKSAGTRGNTSWGWTVGGGVELRPASSSVGLRIEVVNQRSQFTFFEYAGPTADHEFYRDEEIVHPGVAKGDLTFPNMNDLVFSIALTLNR